jgi:hypothetical protein
MMPQQPATPVGDVSPRLAVEEVCRPGKLFDALSGEALLPEVSLKRSALPRSEKSVLRH